MTSFPFLMDSSAPAALAHACKFVTDAGIADRAVYNSINGSIGPEKYGGRLRNSDVDSAIVLAFNPWGTRVSRGREKVLAEGGVCRTGKNPCWELLRNAGSHVRLLDTAANPASALVPEVHSVRSLPVRRSMACQPVAHTTIWTVAWTWPQTLEKERCS